MILIIFAVLTIIEPEYKTYYGLCALGMVLAGCV